MPGRLLIVCPYSVHIAKASVSANIYIAHMGGILYNGYVSIIAVLGEAHEYMSGSNRG